jgi:hypothetical protein
MVTNLNRLQKAADTGRLRKEAVAQRRVAMLQKRNWRAADEFIIRVERLLVPQGKATLRIIWMLARDLLQLLPIEQPPAELPEDAGSDVLSPIYFELDGTPGGGTDGSPPSDVVAQDPPLSSPSDPPSSIGSGVVFTPPHDPSANLQLPFPFGVDLETIPPRMLGTPEPQSVVLLAIGGIGVLGFAWRTKRRRARRRARAAA